MKIALFGYGKMGKAIEKLSMAEGFKVLTKISRNCVADKEAIKNCDVCIDFSSPDSVLSHIKEALIAKKPIVVGTTGWEADFNKAEDLTAEHAGAVLYSPNFSLGVLAFVEILKYSQGLLKNCELAGVEFHHAQKKDCPSGTAKLIQQALEMQNPFASVRMGTLPGKHQVIFEGVFDMITVCHEAKSREGFAQGALKAAKWILNQKGWLTAHDFFWSLYRTHHAL